MYTMRPNYNAGYAVLLTLLGAPVNIGEAQGGLLAWTRAPSQYATTCS